MGGDNGTSQRKVPRVLEKYELEELKEHLPELWLGEGNESGIGVRRLAHQINKEIVRKKLDSTSSAYIEAEVKQIYQVLNSDDVDDEYQRTVEKELEEEGIDVESLRDDFVSHVSLHRYLTKEEGVEKEGGRPERDADHYLKQIEKTRRQARNSVEHDIVQADKETSLEVEDPESFIQMRIYCAKCEKQYTPQELFEQGGCDCNIE